MPMQVNITTKVNSQSIRRETYNDREHLVLPSYTLPANVVMNGGLYTQEQIDAHYKGWKVPWRRWATLRLMVSSCLLSPRRGLTQAISAHGTATLRSPVTVSTSKSGLMLPVPVSLKVVENYSSASQLSSVEMTCRLFIPAWPLSSTSLNRTNSNALPAPTG